MSGGFHAVHINGSNALAARMGDRPASSLEFRPHMFEDMNTGWTMLEINKELGLPFYALLLPRHSDHNYTTGDGSKPKPSHNDVVVWNQQMEASKSFLPKCRKMYPDRKEMSSTKSTLAAARDEGEHREAR